MDAFTADLAAFHNSLENIAEIADAMTAEEDAAWDAHNLDLADGMAEAQALGF